MSSSKPRIVIVGGNFAGLVAASRLSRRFDVTVVDPRTDFEWTPNIHEIISRVKTRGSVVLRRASCVTRYGHTFVDEAVTRIDRASNTVATDSGLLLPYDACLVAAGSVRTLFGVPGGEEFSVGLRTADDAVRIGARLDKLAKRKRRASVVIVGGGVSGVEAVGEIIRRRAQGDRFDVHLIEQASRILPQQPDVLSRDAMERCSVHDIHVHTETSVASVAKRRVTLDTGEKLTADLCIWSAGMTLPDFLQESGLRNKERDWLPVDDTLQSDVAANVFVAGDCAALPTPLRKQAYYAMDMGQVAGDNMARYLQKKPLRRFRPKKMPMLIAFGDVTTWLVAGDYVVASPLLAAAKEGVYQTTMTRFASPHQPLRYAKGVASRAALAAQRLLLPQLRPRKILSNIAGSRLLS